MLKCQLCVWWDSYGCLVDISSLFRCQQDTQKDPANHNIDSLTYTDDSEEDDSIMFLTILTTGNCEARQTS